MTNDELTNDEMMYLINQLIIHKSHSRIIPSYISETVLYHHGEQSLNQTIINMAQDFVGSNNLNLLMPNGQFGTKLLGGKDSASPRYIYTCLAPITHSIIREEDRTLLTQQEEEGISIEPVTFLPILPMVLVNGATGIGTGWSTNVLNHNPIEVVDRMMMMLKGRMSGNCQILLG